MLRLRLFNYCFDPQRSSHAAVVELASVSTAMLEITTATLAEFGTFGDSERQARKCLF